MGLKERQRRQQLEAALVRLERENQHHYMALQRACVLLASPRHDEQWHMDKAAFIADWYVAPTRRIPRLEAKPSAVPVYDWAADSDVKNSIG